MRRLGEPSKCRIDLGSLERTVGRKTEQLTVLPLLERGQRLLGLPYVVPILSVPSGKASPGGAPARGSLAALRAGFSAEIRLLLSPMLARHDDAGRKLDE